jgi:hypothetical protein
VLTRVHDQLLVPLAKRPRDGCRLYELGSITYDCDYAHGEERSVILTAAVRTGLTLVRGTARLAADAASHVLWWVDHHVGGDPRKAPDDPRRRAKDDA